MLLMLLLNLRRLLLRLWWRGCLGFHLDLLQLRRRLYLLRGPLLRRLVSMMLLGKRLMLMLLTRLVQRMRRMGQMLMVHLLLLLLLVMVHLIRNHLAQRREHHLRTWRRNGACIWDVERVCDGTGHVRLRGSRGAIRDIAIDRRRVREEVLRIRAGWRLLRRVGLSLVRRRGVRSRRLLVRLVGVRRRVGVTAQASLWEVEGSVGV